MHSQTNGTDLWCMYVSEQIYSISICQNRSDVRYGILMTHNFNTAPHGIQEITSMTDSCHAFP